MCSFVCCSFGLMLGLFFSNKNSFKNTAIFLIDEIIIIN